MQFFIQGLILPAACEALKKSGHAAHGGEELADQTDAPASAQSSPAELLPLLAGKQWNLFTSDAAFLHEIYETHAVFAGVVVLLVDAETAALQEHAVGRLFERYKRLTPRRLYTVTASRVKVRQLPGARME